MHPRNGTIPYSSKNSVDEKRTYTNDSEPLMKNLTVGFSRSSGTFPIFSWLIMLVQQTNYSHCYLKYTDEVTNKVMVLQASGLQVNLVSYDFFLTKETVIKEFP